VVLTRGATFDNAANLSAEALAELRRRYPEGSRLYRQELLGELVTDIEGALWTHEVIDQYRVTSADVPDRLARVVVAIDPAAAYGPDSDDTGIVIAGRSTGRDGHAYVLDDRTCHLPPDGWAAMALQAYARHEADAIVVEVNQGGAMAVSTINAAARAALSRGEIQAMPRIQQVRATRGKAVRAEPIAALYANGFVHHVGALPELEEQLTTWTPEAPNSPDRLDALVWALTALSTTSSGVAGAF
jgi:phage terminase large subunit-like protein